MTSCRQKHANKIGAALLQACHRDADVKLALRAWAAYGTPGIHPPDLFTPANPLMQAFGKAAPAASPSKASDTTQAAMRSARVGQGANTGSSTKSKEGLTTGPFKGAEPSGQAEQSARAESPTKVELLPPTRQSGDAAPATEAAQSTSPKLSIGTKQVTNANGSAGLVPLTGAQLSMRAGPSGAAPSQSQDAFSMLMRAAKQPSRAMQGVTTTSGSQGNPALDIASKAASSRPSAQGYKPAWQNALQQVALDPEGYACCCPRAPCTLFCAYVC